MTLALGWLWRASVLGLLAFAVFGPLANLLLWAFAIQWYYPHRLPLAYGFHYWGEVFKPTSDAFASLSTSVLIATIKLSSVFCSRSHPAVRLAAAVCRGVASSC